MYSESIVLIGGSLLGAMVVAIEVGTRLGLRRAPRANDAARSQTSAIQASILGMLALLLGFTFSMALGRNDSRAAAIVDEANAIGTAQLRADLLSEPYAGQARQLLQAYTQARIRAGELTLKQETKRGNLLDEASQIGAEIWALAVAAGQADPNPVRSGLFIQAVNDMLDSFASRDAALDRHVPEPALFLLLITFVIAAGLLGYTSGLDRNRPTFAAYAMVALIVLLVMLTLDLDRPRRGLVQVDQAPLQALQSGEQGG